MFTIRDSGLSYRIYFVLRALGPWGDRVRRRAFPGRGGAAAWMRRRDVFGVLGAAVVWPLAASAQPSPGVRRVGALMSVADDSEGQSRLAAFLQKLEDLGWVEGRNLRIDV